MCILFCLPKVGRLGPSVLFQSLDRLETFNQSTHISLERSISGRFFFSYFIDKQPCPLLCFFSSPQTLFSLHSFMVARLQPRVDPHLDLSAL